MAQIFMEVNFAAKIYTNFKCDGQFWSNQWNLTANFMTPESN